MRGHVVSLLGASAVVSLVLIAAGAVFAVVAVVRGPASPDRAVASDVIVTLFMAAVVVAMTVTGLETFVPFLLVLALLGFISSATVARFLGRSDREGE